NSGLKEQDSKYDVAELRPMQGEELDIYFHAPAGFLGPVNLTPAAKLFAGGVNVVLDAGLLNRKNMVCGANQLDYHFRNVSPGIDFQFTVTADIRDVTEGEGCPQCGSPLRVAKAVEIGHIFKLGYKYTESMGARVLDENGKEVTPIMGSYGIGIERILTSAIEQANDENGFWLPPQIAPFEVIVTPTNASEDKLMSVATEIAHRLQSLGID